MKSSDQRFAKKFPL